MFIKTNDSVSSAKNFFKKFVKALERFGRSLIVPIAILPLMAIIGAIGYLLISIGKQTPESIYYTSKIYKGIAEAIKAIGLAPIYNLDILFAIGLATGLAKDEKVSAALCGIAALIGFYFAGNILENYAKISNALPVELTKNLPIIDRFGKNTKFFNFSTLGGILAGYLGYFVHKYTYRLQFPTAIAFFGGPKFSPVATILISFIIGLPFSYIWVYIYYAIAKIGQGVRSSGAGGAFVYGMVERLLIPFGLHHVPNAILRYTSAGGTWTFTNVEGTKETFEGFYSILFAKLDHGVKITVEDSMISNGSYAIKIFSLPGAAVAMFLAVPKEKRKIAAPIIFGAVASSFLSGITEPIEFTFIFVAPILWIAHSVMTGLNFMFLYLAKVSAIAGTGEGIITWFLYNIPAHNILPNFWMLWVLGPIFFLEYLIVFYLLIWKLNLKTPGRDNIEFKLFTKKDFINKKEKLIQDQIEYSKIVTDENIKHEKPEDIQKSIQLINFYGGFENITEVGACISRLRISVLDKEKVKKDAIKNLGAAGIVETNDQVQSVFGAKAMVYARIINNIKNK